MKKIILILITGSFLMSCSKSSEKKEADTGHEMHHQKDASPSGYIDSLNTGLIKEDTLKGSPSRVVMNTVGNTHLHITYHSPGVKGRVIWGGLVPYDQVWVTGAHDATSLQIINPVVIDGKKIDSGTYAIFTIPGKKEWVFILNKNYKQHLADDYQETEDVLRIKVSPFTNPMTPRLAYAISAASDTTGTISMSWEKLKIEVPFSTIK
jgi:hypothetical protein